MRIVSKVGEESSSTASVVFDFSAACITRRVRRAQPEAPGDRLDRAGDGAFRIKGPTRISRRRGGGLPDLAAAWSEVGRCLRTSGKTVEGGPRAALRGGRLRQDGPGPVDLDQSAPNARSSRYAAAHAKGHPGEVKARASGHARRWAPDRPGAHQLRTGISISRPGVAAAAIAGTINPAATFP
ncbi:hypothetical protein ACPA9J_05500 [Pseudomonas aeruginosa]